MVLMPDDDDELAMLREIRQQIANDRTDIQRLWRNRPRTEFMDFAVIENLEAASEESSSSSSSMSLCDSCDVPTSGLTMTVTYVSGTATNTSDFAWQAYLGSHAQTSFNLGSGGTVKHFWDFACVTPGGVIGVSSQESVQGRLFCSRVSGVLRLLPRGVLYEATGCVAGSGDFGFINSTANTPVDTIDCTPFYLHATHTASSGYTVDIEISE